MLPTLTDVSIVGAVPAGRTPAVGLKQPPIDCVSIDRLPDYFRRTLAATA
jgi:2-polyprenyl-6-methoxyphenol hydroxylase-like FAD-dependent oxidoreductase